MKRTPIIFAILIGLTGQAGCKPAKQGSNDSALKHYVNDPKDRAREAKDKLEELQNTRAEQASSIDDD